MAALLGRYTISVILVRDQRNVPFAGFSCEFSISNLGVFRASDLNRRFDKYPAQRHDADNYACV